MEGCQCAACEELIPSEEHLQHLHWFLRSSAAAGLRPTEGVTIHQVQPPRLFGDRKMKQGRVSCLPQLCHFKRANRAEIKEQSRCPAHLNASFCSFFLSVLTKLKHKWLHFFCTPAKIPVKFTHCELITTQLHTHGGACSIKEINVFQPPPFISEAPV